MVAMFQACQNLIDIDVSHFDTSNVTLMGAMFFNCKSLKKLDVTNFNTSNVTDMGGMFWNCESLTELDLSSFDTSNVITTGGNYGMLSYLKLKTIYVSELWDMSNVTNSKNMFLGSTSLVGTVPFDSTKTDVSMANYTTGYLTYKKNTN